MSEQHEHKSARLGLQAVSETSALASPARAREAGVPRAYSEDLAVRLMKAQAGLGAKNGDGARAAVAGREPRRRKAYSLNDTDFAAFASALLEVPQLDRSFGRAPSAMSPDVVGDWAANSSEDDGFAAARRMLIGYLDRGLTPEGVVRTLFPGVARQLGEWWEADTTSLVDVSIAMCRLHGLLRDDTWRDVKSVLPSPASHSVLLGTFAMDQHTFGLSLLADAFRRAGWRVTFAGGTSAKALHDLLSARQFDALALSASTDISVVAARTMIARCRRASRGKLCVVAGGAALNALRASPRRLGVDLFLQDAQEAPTSISEFLALQLDQV